MRRLYLGVILLFELQADCLNFNGMQCTSSNQKRTHAYKYNMCHVGSGASLYQSDAPQPVDEATMRPRELGATADSDPDTGAGNSRGVCGKWQILLFLFQRCRAR